MSEKTKHSNKAHHAVVILATSAVAIVAVLGLLTSGAVLAYGKVYDDRILPGVSIAGVPVGNMTTTQAQAKVQAQVASVLGKGLHFNLNGHIVTLDAAQITQDNLLSYDVSTTVQQAYAAGHDTSDMWRMVSRVLLDANLDLPLQATIDRNKLTNALNTDYAFDTVTMRNASLDITASDQPSINITPERAGSTLVVGPAFDLLQQQANALNLQTIALEADQEQPTVTAKDLELAQDQAADLLQRPRPTFTYKGQGFTPSLAVMASWISTTGTTGNVTATIDQAAFEQGLKDMTADLIVPPKPGSLTVGADGRASSFTPGTDGLTLDADAQYADLMAHWPASTTFPLFVQVAHGTIEGADADRLGIKDLLGIGTSNFGNSPKNRRANIALGIKMMTGTIIPPDSEFSTIKNLGTIDDAHGWLPELVIKDNTTVPEDGGGLCQIGTTTFRMALAAGMPITERQNHSYRVVYYEPAGTDATIYDPQPDLRFMNDTSSSEMIYAYEQGTDVFFQLWGTSDGRVATSTYPKIYDIVQPPPTKLTETTAIPVGTKKCSESAHAGATAEFTYTVTYANGTQKVKVFHSYYKPWQAVCLIGVKKVDTTDTTSTDDGTTGPPEG